MPDHRLRIGMKFRQQGRIYAIEQALPNDHLGIKDILSGEFLAKPRNSKEYQYLMTEAAIGFREFVKKVIPDGQDLDF